MHMAWSASIESQLLSRVVEDKATFLSATLNSGIASETLKLLLEVSRLIPAKNGFKVDSNQYTGEDTP